MKVKNNRNLPIAIGTLNTMLKQTLVQLEWHWNRHFHRKRHEKNVAKWKLYKLERKGKKFSL